MPMHDLNCNHPQPTFQRRHLYRLAAILNTIVRDQKYDWITLQGDSRYFSIYVNYIMEGLERDNHLFDRGRFLAEVWNRD